MPKILLLRFSYVLACPGHDDPKDETGNVLPPPRPRFSNFVPESNIFGRLGATMPKVAACLATNSLVDVKHDSCASTTRRSTVLRVAQCTGLGRFCALEHLRVGYVPPKAHRTPRLLRGYRVSPAIEKRYRVADHSSRAPLWPSPPGDRPPGVPLGIGGVPSNL